MAHRNRAPIDDLVAQWRRGGAGPAGARRRSRCDHPLRLDVESGGRNDRRSSSRICARGQIIVDAGTSEPETTRRLARELGRIGIAYADAPMTGGPEQVGRARTRRPLRRRRQDLRGDRADAHLLCDHASGISARRARAMSAKLISNYLVTGMIALVTEAFAARPQGQARLERSLRSHAERLRQFRRAAQDGGCRRSAGDFDGYRFSIANAAKDIGYYAELAESLGCG